MLRLSKRYKKSDPATSGHDAAIYAFGGSTLVTLLLLGAGIVTSPKPVLAVPSFARQTGQPCATCHTAFPELTPYGREFKLRGYTSGGTRCGNVAAEDREVQVPLAGMWTPNFTHVQKGIPDSVQIVADESTVGMLSGFLAGQLYCNLGSFVQGTFDAPSQSVFLDNTDFRWSKDAHFSGIDVLLGVTANNNPTVQDVWNTTPAWSFPFIASEFAPTPTAATMLGGTTFAGRAGSVGGYVWINNLIYAEFSGYGAFDPNLLEALGQDPGDGTPRFANLAPYWRVALEKTWDKNSFMLGTFGMFADLQPTVGGGSSALAFPGITDPFTDIGADTQYQYIGEIHAFTLRASYINEHEKLAGEFSAGASTHPTDELNEFKISASYIYNHTVSVTGEYFNTWGTSDAILNAGFSSTGSPNSNGWVVDVAYLPFSYGGPSIWPWFNARLGVSYTHYDEFDGSSGVNLTTGRSASDNDTTFVYAWVAF